MPNDWFNINVFIRDTVWIYDVLLKNLFLAGVRNGALQWQLYR